MKKEFQKCVSAVLISKDGKILLGKNPLHV